MSDGHRPTSSVSERVMACEPGLASLGLGARWAGPHGIDVGGYDKWP